MLLRTYRKYSISIILFSTMICCVASCGQRTTNADIVGTYRLTTSSTEYLKKEKAYHIVRAPEIKLLIDNNIVITNLPDCLVDGFGNSDGRFLSGKGKWKIENAKWGSTLNYLIDYGESLEGGWYLGIRIINSRPVMLEYYVGDPDSGNRVRFMKIAS